MNDERLIQILVAQQWEKCKGELRALVALRGSTMPIYEGNNVVRNREWEQLEIITDRFINEVEENGLAE